MATLPFVSVDSELMNNYVSANPLPKPNQFGVVHDENNRPMTFLVDRDGSFYLLKEHVTGQLAKIDLGVALGFKGRKFTGKLQVKQNLDTTLYVVAAIASDAQNELVVLKPLKLDVLASHFSRLLISNNGGDSKSLLMEGSGKVKSVLSIYMADANPEGPFPEVIVSYKEMSSIHGSDDLSRVVVTEDGAKWSMKFDIHMPENASKILDILPAHLPIGRGYFILYNIAQTTHLLFQATELLEGADHLYQALLDCPPNSTSVGTFVESTGYSALLVGGATLQHWKAEDAQYKDSPGTQVTSPSNERLFRDLTQLKVTQVDNSLSIFAADKGSDVAYVTCSLENDEVVASEPTPLVAKGLGGTFVPFHLGESQELYMVDSDGELSRTEQIDSARSGLWRTTPLYTPSLEEAIEIQGYTTHIRLTNQQTHEPFMDAIVLIKSEDGWYNDIVVNGRTVQVGPRGTELQSDSSGTLTIIVPCEDVSVGTFTVSNAPGRPVVFANHGEVTIDPSEKIYRHLKTIKTGADLRAQKTQDGQTLISSTITDSTVDQAATAIAKLVEFRESDKCRRRSKGKRKLASEEDIKIMCTNAGWDIKTSRGVAKGFLSFFSDAWKWLQGAWNTVKDTATQVWGTISNAITGVIEDIKDWTVQAYNDTINFLIDTGETVINFVVETAAEVGKAISTVIDKVIEVGKKVVAWIGFIFNWGDIQECHRSIIAMFNSAMDAGNIHVGSLAPRVDAYFEKLKRDIQQTMYPPELLAATTDIDTPDVDKAGDDSVGVNWTKYQFTHGGAGKAATVTENNGNSLPASLWSTITRIAEQVMETLKTLGSNLALLFNGQKKITTAEILSKLSADLLTGLIDVVKILVVDLIRLVANLFTKLKEFANATVKIPVFSWIYKNFLSGGTDLSMISGLALIVAIPATVVYKIVRGSKPPNMESFNFNDLITGNMTQEKSKEYISFANPVTMSSQLFSGIAGSFEALTSMRSEGVARNSGGLLKFEATDCLEIYAGDLILLSEKEKGAVKSFMKEHWKTLFDFIAVCATCPASIIVLHQNRPAMELRWAKWSLSVLSAANGFAARGAAKAAGGTVSQKQKVLAGVDLLIKIPSFVMSIIIYTKELEFPISQWPEKNKEVIILNTTADCFGLLSTVGEDIAIIASDPMTKTVASGVHWVCMVGQFSCLGVSYTKQGVHFVLFMFN